MRARPSVLHLDLDAFFSAVEQRDKPSLRGKPVVVGGTGYRGVVATASYEARVYGIGSAMPTAEARRRHPHAAYLAPRFTAYQRASEQVMGLLGELSPLVEPLSLDEAYVDLLPAHPEIDIDAATALARDLKARIHAVTALTGPVGIGTSKLVAKIGSDLDKPDGLTVVPPGEEAATLAPLPVRRLPGVGMVTGERLRRHGIATIGDLADADPSSLVSLLGHAHGTGLQDYARGIDPRPVVAERETKSVSSETTFEVDINDRDRLGEHLRRLSVRTAERLVAQGLSGRTVTVKARRYDFSTITRSATLPHATDGLREIAGTASELLAGVDVTDGLRLLGVGVSGLTEYAQQDLLADLTSTPEPVPDDEPEADVPIRRGWRPGQDIHHAEHGAGWVQGSGSGRVTVRFEGPRTPPGPVRTFAVDDRDLEDGDLPEW